MTPRMNGGEGMDGTRAPGRKHITQRWKDIPGYQGTYQINGHGYVRRTQSYDALGRLKAERILRPTKCGNGKYSIILWRDGKRRCCMVHKLLAAAFHISEREAIMRIYQGFEGSLQAVEDVKGLLRDGISRYEEEQHSGRNRHDEILYLNGFLRYLKDIDSTENRTG